MAKSKDDDRNVLGEIVITKVANCSRKLVCVETSNLVEAAMRTD